jgi:nucleotide-binding universal stress UspA family protein
MKLDHILITTDLSSEALLPCEPVAELARSSGARITLLHVVTDVPGIPHGAPFAPPMSSPGLEKRVEEARREIATQSGAFGDMAVDLEVISGGDTGEAIADFAERAGVDLIALSSHGRSGFRHLVLGSVAEGVLRHASVPVLVFPRPKD